jgi:hypothetical protein
MEVAVVKDYITPLMILLIIALLILGLIQEHISRKSEPVQESGILYVGVMR